LLVWLTLSAAMLLARRRWLLEVSQVITARPLRTLTVGVLACLGLVALSVLLALTLVGLVGTALLVGLLLLASVAGFAVALIPILDDRQARRLLTIATVIPLVGDALFAVATAVGLGGLLRYVMQASSQAPAGRMSWR
jgi:hypothetical protein